MNLHFFLNVIISSFLIINARSIKMERKVKIYLTEKGILKNKLFNGSEIKVTLKVTEAKELHYYLIPKNPP